MRQSRSLLGFRIITHQGRDGQVIVKEQFWRPITPHSAEHRRAIKAYQAIFQRFTADIEQHGHGYQAGAWQALLDYFCNAYRDRVRPYVQEDFIAAACALVRALDEHHRPRP